MESKDVTMFGQRDGPGISLTAFEIIRRTVELCDVTETVNDHSVSDNRMIPSAGIPYIRSVFNGCGVQNEVGKVSTPNVDPGALETLKHFSCTGRINISSENVHALLLASEFLQINQVRDACVEFLSNKINISNAVKVLDLAHSLNNSALTEISNRFIRENFEEVSKSDDFLRLPGECVKEIISNDCLNVSCETIVYEAVIHWAKVSPSERQDILPELLNEVRMIHLPVGYLLKTVALEELVSASPPCKDIIGNVKSYHLLPKAQSEFLNLKTQPRKINYIKNSIYALHCWGNSVCYCDVMNQSWQKLKSKTVGDPHAPSEVVAFAVANDNIYLFFRNTVERFGLISLEWELLEPKHEDIEGGAVSSHGNVIYCFGSCSPVFSDTMRRFDIRQNNWMKEEKMKSRRSFSAAAILGETIYVTGGWGANSHASTTVEKYNVRSGQWSEIASMIAPRSSHGCTNLNGMIFVCGGLSVVDFFCRSAEMYNPLTDQWNAISSMNTGKIFVSLISHYNQIYALGSLVKGNEYAREFEVYDPERDQWKSGFSVPEGIRYYIL